MILMDGEPNGENVARIAAENGLAIAPRPHRFMAQDAFDLDALLDFSQREERKLVEFGRTACLAEYRKLGVGNALVHGIHGLGLEYGVHQAVAVGPPSLRAYYETFGCRSLKNLGSGHARKINAELVCFVLDLPTLLGSDRCAHQAASQLKRYDRVLLCKDKKCLEWHNHHPRFHAEPGVDEAAQLLAHFEAPIEPIDHPLPYPAGPRTQRHLPQFQMHDETLRDGLQSPSVRTPSLAEKIEIVQAMDRLGIESANLGLPGAGPRFVEECAQLLSTIAARGLSLRATLAGRTCEADVDAIIEAGQRAGLAPEAGLFIGSSRIRQFCEKWDLADLKRLTGAAVARAVAAGLPVMFVTEDTTRAHPQALRELFRVAIGEGAQRLCLCDTVGQATPDGVRRVVAFAREVVDDAGARVKLDWHGHEDRGLGLVNGLAALEAGVDRVHGTAMGIGERVGNLALEQLLLLLRSRGQRDFETEKLRAYLDLVARSTRRSLPFKVHQQLEHSWMELEVVR